MTSLDLGPGAITWLGTQYRIVLGARETGGGISIVDSLCEPNSGPPRHIHDDADESFYVLSGAVEFWLEGERFLRSSGETVFVPRGREHTFRVVSDTTARMITILTPGGFEGFFQEMAAGQFRIPEDMGPVVESAGRFSLRFTGPPL